MWAFLFPVNPGRIFICSTVPAVVIIWLTYIVISVLVLWLFFPSGYVSTSTAAMSIHASYHHYMMKVVKKYYFWTCNLITLFMPNSQLWDVFIFRIFFPKNISFLNRQHSSSGSHHSWLIVLLCKWWSDTSVFSWQGWLCRARRPSLLIVHSAGVGRFTDATFLN